MFVLSKRQTSSPARPDETTSCRRLSFAARPKLCGKVSKLRSESNFAERDGKTLRDKTRCLLLRRMEKKGARQSDQPTSQLACLPRFKKANQPSKHSANPSLCLPRVLIHLQELLKFPDGANPRVQNCGPVSNVSTVRGSRLRYVNRNLCTRNLPRNLSPISSAP